MQATVQIDPTHATKEGFAVVRVVRDGGEPLCMLDVEFTKLAALNYKGPRALDLLLLASVIYALDKVVPRADAADAWTRNLTLTVPVSDPSVWDAAKPDLLDCLSFLSGDRWQINFTLLDSRLVRPLPRRRRRYVPRPRGDAVCLFSGGLDSLIGAIDRLEDRPQERLLLVGHHDAKMKGVLADQNSLLGHLPPDYRRRVAPLFVRIGHSEDGPEITLRSRSFLFIALGVFVAAAMGPRTPVLMPENGTIALNVPLTPSRRGSCSTRTAHPYYLETLGRVLDRVGLDHPIQNPLSLKTKGEAVAQCRNLSVLQALAPLSVSCAKRGRHRVYSVNKDAPGCGRCMPCVYRRAALHKIALDTERYGTDFCQGEVSFDEPQQVGPNDLRACFSFLKRNPSAAETERMLLANASLDLARLPAYADLVRRAMDEIRSLIRDKAIPDIRREAGVA